MSETQKILQMLENGTITADEASSLLQAVAGGHDTAQVEGDVIYAEQDASPAPTPDLERFRRFSQIPFAIALTVLLVSGWGTYTLSRQAEGRVTFGFVMVLIVLVVAILATVVSLWMTFVPWLHVRIQSKDGKRIAVSLPLPLTLADWGIRVARHYVDRETVPHLDAASELVKAVRSDLGKPGTDPITVSVDDSGDRVQVYLG